MGKGLFVTATGTDIGKTYVTALIVKKICEAGYTAGYYKAALSGADVVRESDAGYVKKESGIRQEDNTMVSYVYRNSVSPHLAAQMEGHPAEWRNIRKDYETVKQKFDYITVEGSGGIVCPIRWDEKERIMLEDIIQCFKIRSVLVADAGLGTINATVLTAEYMKRRDIGVSGIILNHYTGSRMQEDNKTMIEKLTGIPVIACVEPEAREIKIGLPELLGLYS